MAKSRLRSLRIRLWLVGTVSLFSTLGLPLMVAIIVAFLQGQAPTPAANIPLSEVSRLEAVFGPVGFIVVVGLFAIAVIGLAVHSYFEYLRRKYDPTWVMEFVKDWDSEDYFDSRGRAAILLRDNANELRDPVPAFSDVDPVLDFFDSVGFYMLGGQMSPEVVHQEFHYWVRGYYQAARDYIEARQMKEATLWEYLPELYETLQGVEAEGAKSTFRKLLSKEELNDFFQEEINISEAAKE